MDKCKLTKLQQETALGKFQKVLHQINTLHNECDERVAVKIIIECCRVLVDKNSILIMQQEQDLLNLLLKCKEFINNLYADVVCSYWQSLYFIVEYFIKQDKLQHLLEIKGLIISDYAITIKNSSSQKSYNSIYGIIYNKIVKLMSDQSSILDCGLLCEVCLLSLKMKRILCSTLSMTSLAAAYCTNFTHLKMDLKTKYLYYLKVIEIIETDGEVEHLDYYSAIVKFAKVALKDLQSRFEFEKVSDFSLICSSAVSKMKNTELTIAVINVFNSIAITAKEIKCKSVKSLKHNAEVWLSSLKDLYNNPTLLQDVGVLLYTFVSEAIQYIHNNFTIWDTNVESSTCDTLHEVVISIANIIEHVQFKCTCCSNCKVKTMLYWTILLHQQAGTLLKMMAEKKLQSTMLMSKTHIVLKTSCRLILKLQQLNCLTWKNAWARIAMLLYNIASTFYSFRNKECNEYFQLLLESIVKLEQNRRSSIFRKDVTNNALRCMASVHEQNFSKALMYAAILVFLSPDDSEVHKFWIAIKCKIKENASDNDKLLFEKSVVCILQEHEKDVCQLIYDFNLNSELIVNLLIRELQFYKKMYPSGLLLWQTFKSLYEVSDLIVSVKILLEIWLDNILLARKDLFEIVDEAILNLESNKLNHENSFYLGLLYGMQYFFRSTTAKNLILDEMNVLNTALPSVDGTNNDDECHMISSYTNLTVTDHLTIITCLYKAVSMENSAVEYIPGTTLLHYNVYETIARFAHEFRLHCDHVRTIQCWLLCLKIAKILDNKLQILQSISFLLETSNMHSETISELLFEAEALASNLKLSENVNDKVALTEYFISRSYMFINNKEVESAFRQYEEALIWFTKIGKENENKLLYIRLEFLHIQFLQLPCEVQVANHDTFYLSIIGDLLVTMSSFLNHQGCNNSLAVSIWFEIYIFLVTTYRWMYLPREVRCYSRYMVVDAQKMYCPFQTAHFLIQLAHADLQSTRVDDCRIKLNGLMDILSLSNNSILQNCVKRKKDKSPGYDEIVESLSRDTPEMVLDCFTKNKDQTTSPVLVERSIEIPSFLKHVLECTCFFCTSAEYQKLVLEVFNLEALYHILRENKKAAKACFNICLLLYSNINNSAFKIKIDYILKCYPIDTLKKLLQKNFFGVLVYYVNFLIRKGDFKEAEVYNALSLTMVEKHDLIYNEALFQKSIIIQRTENTFILLENSFVEEQIEVIKTPENQRTKVIIACQSPSLTSPPKRRLLKIKCDFTDCTEANEEEKFKSPGDSKDNKNILKVSLPLIKLTSPELTILKKKDILKEIHNQSKPTENSLYLNAIYTSPTSYSPAAIKMSSALQSKTKLLTKKLKATAVKDDDCTEKKSNAESSKKVAACKNLTNEFYKTEKLNTGSKQKNKSSKNTSSNTKENNLGKSLRSRKTRT